MRTISAAAAAISFLIGEISVAQEENKFELFNGIIFVQAMVNDKGPFDFIFDTGASVTVLRPDFAKAQGIEADKTNKMPGANQFAVVKSIGVGKNLVKDLKVAVMAVPQADVPLSLLGKKYCGILGFNYISRFELTLNYEKKFIKLTPTNFDPGDPLQQALGALTNRAKSDSKKLPKAGFTYESLEDSSGIKVLKVVEGSAAETAGLKAGDVITEAGGKKISSGTDWREALKSAGKELAVKFQRDGEEQTARLKLR